MSNMSEYVTFHDLHLEALHLDDVRAYIEETGWKNMQYPGDRLLVFEGPENDDGRPIILSLPAKRGFRDTNDRLLDAINLLATVEQTSPSIIVQKIQSRDRDTMLLRLDLPPRRLPSVEAISSIIHGWRDLITFSACMEQEHRPFFEKSIPIGKQQSEHFGFGHTFQGSFGLTIESHVSESPHLHQTLLAEQEDHLPLPIERRVIERITRGLVFVREAERRDSSRIISDNFTTGLNANMCNALLEVLEGIQDIGLEYTVSWSPRWQPSLDVFQPEPIILQKSVSSYMKDAAKTLKSLTREPQKIDQIQDVLIQGPIIELSSGDIDHRTVVIGWQDQQESVTIPLELEDYQIACDAHRDGRPVSIRGRIRKKGKKSWILINPYDFKIE